MYCSTLALTSALVRSGWPTPRPGRFTRRKVTEVGWSSGPSEQVRKISAPPAFDPWTVQPIASRYTNCTKPAHETSVCLDLITRIIFSMGTALLSSAYD